MGNKIQILLIDADSLLRDGVCALLNSEEELQVIGAVGHQFAPAERGPGSP